MGKSEHNCEWRTFAEELAVRVKQLEEELAALKRHIYGKRSEKMPPMDREVKRDKKADPAAALEKRRANAKQKATKVITEAESVPVPEDQRTCPKCTGGEFTPLSSSKQTTITEYVPGYFRRRTYTREKLACRCGKHIITAPVPEKVFERTQYGPGFMAYLVVSKVVDCIPLYRQEKIFQRSGVPISRSTMNDLFHRVGSALGLIAQRILAQIAASDIVQADETTHRTQKAAGKKSYVWTFVSGKNIGYRFSSSRSGKTPLEVLGGTPGTLVVDAYTGYNAVTDVDGRERAACLAHVRRKFFEALPDAPDAAVPLEHIRQIYIIEHRAREQGISGTDQHQLLRERHALPHLDKLYMWMHANAPLHPPKSKLGRAISYTRKNWQALTRFIKDARIPPDNNASERALRTVALGRKNFLFVGNQASGEHLANLYTVLATCEAHRVDPQAYLTDVLMRLDTPASEVDQLLPANWRPPGTES